MVGCSHGGIFGLHLPEPLSGIKALALPILRRWNCHGRTPSSRQHAVVMATGCHQRALLKVCFLFFKNLVFVFVLLAPSSRC
uniref:Uncharacterized protein n=1 Tax=Anguilla anguilla TaxID=7936 RepID=A0A0E9Q5Z5_ANGAN